MKKKTKMLVVTPDKYLGSFGEHIDPEPCATYDNCADIMTPKQAMLKMLAGGQVADLRRRATYYDEQEMEEYTEAVYPCDYVELYNDYLAKITPLRQKEAKVNENVKKDTKASEEKTTESVKKESDSKVKIPEK